MPNAPPQSRYVGRLQKNKSLSFRGAARRAFGDVVATGLTTIHVWESLHAKLSQDEIRRLGAHQSDSVSGEIERDRPKLLAISGRYDPTFQDEFSEDFFSTARANEVSCKSLRLTCGHYSLGEAHSNGSLAGASANSCGKTSSKRSQNAQVLAKYILNLALRDKLRYRRNIRRESAVFVNDGRNRAHQRVCLSRLNARLQRRLEVDPLACGKQLNRDHVAQRVQHPLQPPRRAHPHRHVIFLVARCGNRIDRMRSRQRLQFARERRSHHLRDHESRIQSRVRRQKWRQQARVRVRHVLDAALTDSRERRQRDGDLVCRHGQWLSVKISAAHHLSRIRKYQRIIRRAVELN